MAAADRVLLFPHVNPDPDAIGSCMALCRILRQQGRTVWILTDRKLPGYLQFFEPEDSGTPEDGADHGADPVKDPGQDPDGRMITQDAGILGSPDLCVMVDCSEDIRISGREKAYYAGKTTLCIDHHRTVQWPYDHCYVDSQAAATAQIVYRLFRQMNWPPDRTCAEYLYAGIAGDTGCFMHSNTSPEVHRIAADLQELGADTDYVNVRLFQSKDLKAVKTCVKALETMELLVGGRAVISKMTKDDFRACGAQVDHADTVIDELRVINGVEIAAFLKEDGPSVRANLRAKSDADVAAIAMRFGGGGHIKAAGFSSELPMEEIYGRLKAEILRALEDETE